MEQAVKQNQVLGLDLTDPIHAALSSYAGRIGKLLTASSVQGNLDLAGSLDDFLGAVYALIQAKQHSFADRTGPIEITAVQERAQKIAVGQVRIDGKWVAGFYFNNALFRIAAIYHRHRVLKIVVGKKAYVTKLVPKAKTLYPQWTNSKLDAVHDQVNDLKHTPRGVYDQRTVTYDDAVAAVGELLVLIEAWAFANTSAVPKIMNNPNAIPTDPKLIEAIVLACLEKNPIDFYSVDEPEAKRVMAAINRATTSTAPASALR